MYFVEYIIIRMPTIYVRVSVYKASGNNHTQNQISAGYHSFENQNDSATLTTGNRIARTFESYILKGSDVREIGIDDQLKIYENGSKTSKLKQFRKNFNKLKNANLQSIKCLSLS